MRSANRRLADVVRNYRLFLLVIGGYIAAGLCLQRIAGIAGLMGQLWYGETFLLYYVLLAYSAVGALALTRWSTVTRRRSPESGSVTWRATLAEFKARYVDTTTGPAALLISLTIPLFMNAFGSWKSAIPRLHPFTWDPALAQWDQLLHGGHHPWQLLQPLIGTPLVTAGLDFVYGLLIPVQVGVLLWQTWSSESRLKRQFFLTYVLTWVLLGTVAAVLMASAGPCFYGRMTGSPDPFAALMRYLESVDATTHLQTLDLQEGLWRNYTHSLTEPFAGISAMPSLHIAMPTLFFLVGRQVSRPVGWIFLTYLVLNLIGSVHLGWHYAIDGYVSIAGVCLIWAIAGRCLRSTQSQPRPL
jgi:hypothetical protein